MMSVAPYALAADTHAGTRSHRQNAGSAAQRGTGNGHQADRADPDNEHRVAKLDVGQFRAVESGGNHIAEHTRGGRVDAGPADRARLPSASFT